MTDYVSGGSRLGDVPRTTAAVGAEQVAAALAARSRPPAGWWGMLMLIASEGALFAAFIGTFFYLRFNHAAWPPPGDPEPKVVVPLVLVALLSSTSVLMQAAWRSARTGRLAAVRVLLVSALLVQCGYLAYEVHSFQAELRTLPIGADAYSSSHYVLLAADHVHVFVGILFVVWLIWKLSRGITMYRANALQAITWYWHFVNLLTWVVTLTIISAAIR
jgi:heme/copper-type cytochrome/quinol oxidase subunit 3